MEFKYNNYIEKVEFIEIVDEKEEWKEIYGYEGIYKISNFGKIMSLERYDSFGRKHGGIILSEKDNGNGYKNISLSKDGKKKYFYIHRLVAMHFIENDNPIEKTYVHHIDENTSNNHYRNLMWVTQSENNIAGHRMMRISETAFCKNDLKKYETTSIRLDNFKIILSRRNMDINSFDRVRDIESDGKKAKYFFFAKK